ncbi:thiamine ABC transporter substrate-binding protein [Thermococcus thioreducens]|uniref:ABC transporter substrate-binding protein n=1 Tax=Thermococcus thioreducens TaxID=277988 RepID=A0A0Q2RE84_9EURY|nr:thiamine ABC transporter substrate-binding protein [Thermococcus thioreducens]ASJ12818.1 ABC transporter substrate-binding protein [Thermococcus thioreducens]KQH82286.1 ABC transporter substrate-binding protein [Thermococcus thioreducens]SEV84784.1 thiamine transport system substrate-binding protein [Thermococcus thioreducens]
MRKLATLLLTFLLLGALGAAKPVKAQEQLTVYSYDSIEWWMKEIVPIFEEKYGVKVNLVLIGDAGEVLNRLVLEKDNPQADVVVGIDNSYMAKAIDAGILEPYKPANADVIPQWIIDSFDPTFHLTPYDYGYIAINYRRDMVQNPPASLEDLTKPEWKGKLIIEDPRTSSPGMAFLLWTIAVYGDDWLNYWERLKENDVQIVEGWSAAWNAFTKGEYPLVLSYATSPAATVYYDNNTNVGAVAFKEGNYLQIEGAGIVKGAKHPELAKKFIEFLISEEAQEKLPLNQWMYPVNKNVQIPEVFKYAVKVDKPVTVDPKEIENNYDLWLKQWTQLMVEGKSPEEITGKTTTETGGESSNSSICGPALIVGLAVLPLFLRRRR